MESENVVLPEQKPSQENRGEDGETVGIVPKLSSKSTTSLPRLPSERKVKRQKCEDEGPVPKLLKLSSTSTTSLPIVKEGEVAEQKESKNENENNSSKPMVFAEFVAAHYNSVESGNDMQRKFSKIYYLRNFNNLMKTLLIKDSIQLLPESPRNLKVLDMCCGKGGDIIKWIKSNVKYLICVDIAEKSLENCKERLSHLVKVFNCVDTLQTEVISADCTRVRLCRLYKDPSINLDMVSTQFSFHYSFESLPQVECMLMNVADRLKPGGLFIGTIPNSNEIVKRLRLAGKNTFGNELFSLEMCSSEPYPLFGAKYHFYLEGVVNCPEFLVYFPVFEKLASKFGLKLLKRRRFDEFYEEHKDDRESRILIKRIKALESYPRDRNQSHGSESDYKTAKAYWEQHESRLRERGFKIGTISEPEWEVITLYEMFIFQKQKV